MLITGESGIGKTAVAKFVHAISDRSKSGNFIHVNCSAIPETLLESELFGFEEGAFTGARKTKTGFFEMANGGTLFLDEIGDMPLSLQSKILNVLQERKFYRIGGVKEINTDVRIIAATNANLEELMAKGRFRLDLYYRLNVIPVSIPPLRDRTDDIGPLLTYYLQCNNQKHNQSKTLSPEVLEVLLRYDWPGNIRELMNLIERMVLIVDEPEIKLKHLPFDIITKTRTTGSVEKDTGGTVSEAVAGILNRGVWQPNTDLKDLTTRIENVIIEEAVLACGSLKKAAKNLGVDVTTLIRKRKRNETKVGI
jgi:transcriptional regulator with PAS, ATPase and Fis domain